MENSPLTPDHILQTGMAFWGSKTLLSAVELELFTRLAESPGTEEEVRERLGLHPRASRDFLDALVSMGFLSRNGDGVYGNTAETDLFLDKAKPSYIGGILEMANNRLYPNWGALTTALQTGEQQNEADVGEDLFGAIYSSTEKLREFLSAMTGVSRGANMAIARQFPWKEYSTFVDAGPAQGDLAVQIALANPHLKGIGFDLAQVQPVFEEYVEANGVSDRVTFQGGSFFDDPIPEAEVVLFGHILHDWDLEQKKHLLRAAYEALPEGGSVIVYESFIDDDRSQNSFGLLMSLNMLVETDGGFDYTFADCQGWMKEAGFRETRVEHLVGPDSMVVGVK